MQSPTLRDVLAARGRIAPYLARTPLHGYPALDALLGTPTWIKHENYQPVGAFKIRGGINLIAQLSPDERARGVIAASTGNHGQSVAYAAPRRGRGAHRRPRGGDAGKVAAMRGMDAEVIVHGPSIDAARAHCEELAREHGYRYIHSGDEPALLAKLARSAIAGVATATLEMIEDEPGLEVLIVPVGGGSGAAGACVVAKAINPRIRVVGVQASAAPAAYESWRQRALVSRASATFAEGLATGAGFALPQAILWELLDDFVLVEDAAILRAMGWMVEHAHTLAEGAGAAPLAAAYQLRDELYGRRVGLVCSGGNTSLAHLRQALAASEGV